MIAFDPIYIHPLPQNHRFPMEKYDLLPKQLLYEGTIHEEDLMAPEVIQNSIVERVHCLQYLYDLKNLKIPPKAQRQSGFVHSDQLIKREWTIMEGTRMATEFALQNNIAFNIAGGTHHAFYNRGEGFCLLNDQVISAQWLLDQELVSKVLIIDLDVHQGNGTAALCKDNNHIYTFSMHGKNNYPLRKEKSDVDIELEDGIKDNSYIYQLETQLDRLGNTVQADIIFYQCGVDVLETDKLGRLGLSLLGCKKRDELVFEFSKNISAPVVCTMGGGYSKEIKHIVEAHANTFRVGLDLYT